MFGCSQCDGGAVGKVERGGAPRVVVGSAVWFEVGCVGQAARGQSEVDTSVVAMGLVALVVIVQTLEMLTEGLLRQEGAEGGLGRIC